MAMGVAAGAAAASFTASADSSLEVSSKSFITGGWSCNSTQVLLARFPRFKCFRSIKASSSSSSTSPAASASASATISSKPVGDSKKKSADGDVKMITTQEEFDTVLKEAGERLVVVEYAASHSVNSKKIYPAMVELSRTCTDVVFRLILGDESEGTRAMFDRAGVAKVPHFIFYKNMEKIHEEEGITEDTLLGDVLYYSDSHSSSIKQLHSRKDVQALIEAHKSDGKLIVLDVGLKHCGPCVKVYPTVIKLARKMEGTAVFARMHGDENDDCMALLKEMNVLEVPTFVFIKDGEVKGRYVGSGKGELIGEILKHQGVF